MHKNVPALALSISYLATLGGGLYEAASRVQQDMALRQQGIPALEQRLEDANQEQGSCLLMLDGIYFPPPPSEKVACALQLAELQHATDALGTAKTAAKNSPLAQAAYRDHGAAQGLTGIAFGTLLIGTLMTNYLRRRTEAPVPDAVPTSF